MNAGFQITGKHVLAAFVIFFGVIIIANTILISLAVKSFPGEQEEKSYIQGLAYNETLKRRAEQQARGWSVSIDKAELAAVGAVVQLSFKNNKGDPINGLAINAIVSRVVDNDIEIEFEFAPVGDGAYKATIPGLSKGEWRLQALASRGDGEDFELSSKVFLE